MKKETKQCCVRIPQELHNWAKGYAYHTGLSLQDYICLLIQREKRVQEAVEEAKYQQIDK